MAFATNADMAARLGVTFTAVQRDQADAALEAASALIAAELDRIEADINPVPELIKQVTITVALRINANPQGASSESETLGSYSHSASYRQGAELSAMDRLLVRRAYFGASSGSARPESTVDETYDFLYGS